MPLFYTPPVPPSIISNDWSQPGNVVTTTYTANQVILYAFEVQAQTVITGIRWHMGATATGHTNGAIYTLAGNLVSGSDTGATANSANADVTATYGTAVSLAPGQYFAALSSGNGTDTYMARNAGASNKAWRGRVATNTATGADGSGVMPSTTGAILTALSNPSFALVVQNGLS